MTGNIGSLLNFYKQERNIFGRCPHCSVPFRLSDVKLTYGKEPPRDLLSQLQRERERLQERVDELDGQIEEMEEEHKFEIDSLNEDWGGKVENEVDKRLSKKEKEIRERAIAKSRAGQLGKTLEKIVPMFPGFGHHPYDVRPIFDPIDFVIFDGYYRGSVRDIVFVEFKTGQSRLSSIQGSIKAAIHGKRIHFEEKRLSRDALRRLTEGRRPCELNSNA
jgi:predicted Holliday junction resolvase-like endonuclease